MNVDKIFRKDNIKKVVYIPKDDDGGYNDDDDDDN